MTCNHTKHFQYQGNCGCGCHGHGGDQPVTVDEKRARLEQYKEDLRKELQAVEQRISALQAQE